MFSKSSKSISNVTPEMSGEGDLNLQTSAQTLTSNVTEVEHTTIVPKQDSEINYGQINSALLHVLQQLQLTIKDLSQTVHTLNRRQNELLDSTSTHEFGTSPILEQELTESDDISDYASEGTIRDGEQSEPVFSVESTSEMEQKTKSDRFLPPPFSQGHRFLTPSTGQTPYVKPSNPPFATQSTLLQRQYQDLEFRQECVRYSVGALITASIKGLTEHQLIYSMMSSTATARCFPQHLFNTIPNNLPKGFPQVWPGPVGWGLLRPGGVFGGCTKRDHQCITIEISRLLDAGVILFDGHRFLVANECFPMFSSMYTGSKRSRSSKSSLTKAECDSLQPLVNDAVKKVLNVRPKIGVQGLVGCLLNYASTKEFLSKHGLLKEDICVLEGKVGKKTCTKLIEHALSELGAFSSPELKKDADR
ncbi:hypothetical protein GEMRC1_012943 [Eukaryota sp. GEM-RC1]